MRREKVKIIVTIGPSTNTEESLRRLKARRVDFVRINMSHSSTDDLRYFIGLAKSVGLPFIVDTEGSQIRTGELRRPPLHFKSGDTLKLLGKQVRGDLTKISIRSPEIIGQLVEGDIVYCDFDSLVLRICDTTAARLGQVTAQVVASGLLGSNKGAVIHSAFSRKQYKLPALSPKDYESIKIGLREGVDHIAASFMRSGAFVDEVRRATEGRMKIISKIECVDGLDHLDEIIGRSDYLLVDRGDLSKEIGIERVPLTTKMIIVKAARAGKGTYVATNLLESMIEKSKPTRAEIHDIQQTVLDGAYGLTLAAETAIGSHPFLCVNTLLRAVECVEKYRTVENRKGWAEAKVKTADSLISPHGGTLVDGLVEEYSAETLSALPHLSVSDEHFMDAEQIALGTFSPLRGFMVKEECESVLGNLRLPDGTVWPLPIVLDVSSEEARRLPKTGGIVLTDSAGEPFGLLNIREKYPINKEAYARKLYGTDDLAHPGVKAVAMMKSVLLGGTVSVFRRRPSLHKHYELSPRQARRLFEDMGWRKVVGFHTGNVPNRAHEFIQLEALRQTLADGLFVHSAVGKKKKGDFHSAPIIRSYELMTQRFYPLGKVIFGTGATFSRYAGPREAMFTALCRQNFGCSHFIVGRDHTGVGNFYPSNASRDIFEQVGGDLGIVPVRFDNVFYSSRERHYVHEAENNRAHREADKLRVSATQARQMLLAGKRPPRWFMRPEISKLIVEMIKNGENVFV